MWTVCIHKIGFIVKSGILVKIEATDNKFPDWKLKKLSNWLKVASFKKQLLQINIFRLLIFNI